MRFMFTGMLAAYLMGNLYIFFRGWQSVTSICALLNASKGALAASRIVYAVLFWIAAASLFIAMFSRNGGIPSWLQGGMYNVGSVWLVFTLYMVLALLLVDISSLVFHFNKAPYGFCTALAFTVLLLVGGYLNYRNPDVEKVEIVVGKGNAGSVQDGTSGEVRKRIVAISDVHLGYATGKKDLQRYVELINSLHPDIILIAGDLIDNSIAPVRQQRMQEELCNLSAPDGIYMALGNHEYISGVDEVADFLMETPVVLLRDSTVTLPCGLSIVGCDDRSNRNRIDVEQLLQDVDGQQGAVILLDHQPYDIALKDSLGVDIQFSGHTHRGQVWPMSLLVDGMYEQSHGYRKWNNSHVIVSSGLSLWGPPFRIGTSSDLWVIDVKL